MDITIRFNLGRTCLLLLAIFCLVATGVALGAGDESTLPFLLLGGVSLAGARFWPDV